MATALRIHHATLASSWAIPPAKNAQTTASSAMISSNANNVRSVMKIKNLISKVNKFRFVMKSAVMVSGTKLNVMTAILPMVMVAAVNVLLSLLGHALTDLPYKNPNASSIFLKRAS